MANLLSDVRLALRTLRAHWVFSALTIVTLALGIGANTAIFSAINGVFLRPLPYRNAGQVLVVEQPALKLGGLDNGFSVIEVQAYGAQAASLASADEYHSMTFTLYGQGDPARVVSGVVSSPFFDDLGVRPILGRTFRPGEDAIGAPANAILSYRFWQTKFQGDPGVVGRTFTMNDRIHTIIGVLPPLPDYPDGNDIFIPAGSCPFRSAPAMMRDPGMRMVNMFVRLKSGVSASRALSDMRTVSGRLHAAYPAAYPETGGLRVTVAGLSDRLTHDARPTLFALLAMTGLLLLIACANVANLTVARHIRRSRDTAVRIALGAGRGRLLRQLGTESVLLALAGGAAGLLLASGSIGLLRQLAAHFTPRSGDIRIDASVLLFTLIVSVATGLVFGALPALPGRLHLSATLRDGGAVSWGTSRGRLRAGLVVGQVAVAFVLLVSAGLLARTLVNLRRVDPGYSAAHVMTAVVPLNWTQYTTDSKITVFVDDVLRRLRGAPEVLSAGVANGLPLDGLPASQRRVTIEQANAARRAVQAETKVVGGDYFRTIGAGLARGRLLSDADRTEPVVVVSETAARELWPGLDPLGQRVSGDSGSHWFTVVGVVRDVRDHDLTSAVGPVIYVPFALNPRGAIRILVQSGTPPAAAASLIRDAVRATDPLQPVADLRTLESLRTATLASPQLTTTLSLCFSLVALVLTAAGLAGVMAFSVTQRTQELGIRLALGADRSRVLLMVVRQGMVWVILGIGIGLIGALIIADSLRGLLFGVSPTDRATYTAVFLTIVVVTLGACLVPARRATKVDPLTALRSV